MTTDTHILEQLSASIRAKELIVVVGAGVSGALTNGALPGWVGLLENGLGHALSKGKINDKQHKRHLEALSDADMDELLGVAEFVSSKLGAPSDVLYHRWLQGVFEAAKPENKAIQEAILAIHQKGVRLATLNYDHLLEQITGLPSIILDTSSDATRWMQGKKAAIMHLHGSYEKPESVILGIRDYQTTQGNALRDLIQKSLAAFKHLLFIGCGDTFADPNFSALTKWLTANLGAAPKMHYALVRADEVAKRHKDSSWHGFVEPLSYGAKYDDLPIFLHALFAADTTPTTKAGTTAKRASTATPRISKAAARKAAHEAVIANYRQFLLKDCGDMTIEGIQASMDTTNRRFDLERLFVPLALNYCEPDISPHDPERTKKMLDWQKKAEKTHSFAKVFAKNKRLALLALPGGGKTLLLKRLAVAYADPARRLACDDALPDLALLPLLIRCREWRAHIHLPLMSLLQKLPEITGQPQLAGLSEAIQALLAEGKVLLLIDGLDEIHDDAARTTFANNVEKFLLEHDKIRLVVTSREAGFSLVAPCVARFCERMRIAPLNNKAITLLCGHWQALMASDSATDNAATKDLLARILQTPALLQLAENPLMLTMLLVVKQSAGRLPADRVSLYQRATDILLDTWNIQGYDPINPREALPQLAFVAFTMMCNGKQTATEDEMLEMLEQARAIPSIARYAQGSALTFLKRVERRSSLFVEAGYQEELGKKVPFYQFRHLTFQEYLAALAVVEGHYAGYQKNETVLTPLQPYLLLDQWKEVIPMVAVLAKKQAEPLLLALLEEGKVLQEKMLACAYDADDRTWLAGNEKPLAATLRLLQCLVEEAELEGDALTSALQLIVLLAWEEVQINGYRQRINLTQLSSGPYAKELLAQTAALYATMHWPRASIVFYGYLDILAEQYPRAFLHSKEGRQQLAGLLASTDASEVINGLMICASSMHLGGSAEIALPHFAEIEGHLFHTNPAVYASAALVCSWLRNPREAKLAAPTNNVLDRLLALYLVQANSFAADCAGSVLGNCIGMPQAAWQPSMSKSQVTILRQKLTLAMEESGSGPDVKFLTATVVAFHVENIIPLPEVTKRLFDCAKRLFDYAKQSSMHFRYSQPKIIKIQIMLRELGDAGVPYLAELDKFAAKLSSHIPK